MEMEVPDFYSVWLAEWHENNTKIFSVDVNVCYCHFNFILVFSFKLKFSTILKFCRPTVQRSGQHSHSCQSLFLSAHTMYITSMHLWFPFWPTYIFYTFTTSSAFLLFFFLAWKVLTVVCSSSDLAGSFASTEVWLLPRVVDEWGNEDSWSAWGIVPIRYQPGHIGIYINFDSKWI